MSDSKIEVAIVMDVNADDRAGAERTIARTLTAAHLPRESWRFLESSEWDVKGFKPLAAQSGYTCERCGGIGMLKDPPDAICPECRGGTRKPQLDYQMMVADLAERMKTTTNPEAQNNLAQAIVALTVLQSINKA